MTTHDELMVSPFPYQGPLEPEQVQGRSELIANLVERVSARRVTALVGPRRYGKTTALRKVRAICEEAGTTVVWIDTYGVTSTADLVVRIDNALAATTGPGRNVFANVAASVAVNLGVFQLEFARKRAERPDADASLQLLLDTLVRGAADTPTVVIVDEFASIVDVGGAAEVLRTKLQHHVQQIGLLFAGSQPSTMTALFTDPVMPWYNQADLITIEPFDPAEVAAIVDDGFTSTGRDPGGLAASLHHFTGGHPHRTMQLADAAWRVVSPGDPYTDDIWASALADVRAATARQHEALFDVRSNSARSVLRALAHGRPIFGSTLELYDVSSSSMRAARRDLTADGTITETDSGLIIVDPLFADWIRSHLPL